MLVEWFIWVMTMYELKIGEWNDGYIMALFFGQLLTHLETFEVNER
jgi:hypothetical protein